MQLWGMPPKGQAALSIVFFHEHSKNLVYGFMKLSIILPYFWKAKSIELSAGNSAVFGSKGLQVSDLNSILVHDRLTNVSLKSNRTTGGEVLPVTSTTCCLSAHSGEKRSVSQLSLPCFVLLDSLLIRCEYTSSESGCVAKGVWARSTSSDGSRYLGS